jgi:ABC-2 family transporter protein
MFNKQVRALIGNDLRLHWRGVAALQLGLLGFMALLFWVALAKPTPVVASAVVNCNILAIIQFGNWIVSREKTKGTFAWLRTLPISDREIVTAKMLTCALWCISMWVSSSLLFARNFFFPGHWPTWVIYQLALLGGATFSLAGRWRFREKLGIILPGVAFLVPWAGILLMDKAGIPVVRYLAAFYSGPGDKGLVIVGLAIFCAGIRWATVTWVSRSDTYELLE